jgi:hypothetical protein
VCTHARLDAHVGSHIRQIIASRPCLQCFTSGLARRATALTLPPEPASSSLGPAAEGAYVVCLFVGTVAPASMAINTSTGAVLLETETGEPRALDRACVARHVEGADALTAHGADAGMIV